MKKIIIPILVLVAWTTVLPAQITRGEADTLVKEYLQSENVVYNLLYVNVNAPSAEGIVITTSNQETFQAKYACWAYYLNENELSQCRYLFVKADNGNLLEVIASNDLGQSDLTQWKTIDDSVGIVGTRHATSLLIYPNPTNGQLIVEIADQVSNDVQDIEIFDVLGKRQYVPAPSLSERAGGEVKIDISHLPAGIYFLSISGETRVVYKIIKK